MPTSFVPTVFFSVPLRKTSFYPFQLYFGTSIQFGHGPARLPKRSIREPNLLVYRILYPLWVFLQLTFSEKQTFLQFDNLHPQISGTYLAWLLQLFHML